MGVTCLLKNKMQRRGVLYYLVGAATLALLAGYLVSCRSDKPEKSAIQSIHIIERGSYLPAYRSLLVESDGAAVYESGTYAPKNIEETLTGRIDNADLERTIDLLYEMDFFSMNGRHYDERKILDASTTEITVRTNEKEYIVSQYGGAGPEKLGKINEQIWGLKDKIKEK